MEKVQANLFGKVVLPQNGQKTTSKFNPYLKDILREAALCLGGFLCGRLMLFNIFNPVGVAYLSFFYMEGYDFYIMSAMVLLGMITGGNIFIMPRYIICIILSCIINFILSVKIKHLTAIQKSILGFISITVSGVLLGAFNQLSRYMTIMAFVEGIMVFSLTYVMNSGLKIIRSGFQKKILTSEESTAIILIVCAAIGGIGNGSVFGVSLKSIFYTIAILIAGYRGGVGLGATAGGLLGFILMLCQRGDTSLFCALTIAGLFSGAMRAMGRFVSFISFFLGMAVIGFYMDNGIISLDAVKGILFGGAIFLFIPKRTISHINTAVCYENQFNEDEYFIRMKELTEEKLKEFSRAFVSLSKIFKPPQGKITKSAREANDLIDDVVKKVCPGCGMNIFCWKEGYYGTYKYITDALMTCEKRGQVVAGDLEPEFIRSCARIDSLIEALNRAYDLHMSNLVWESRIEESRDLVSQQLKSVGKIMDSLSDELDVRIMFKEGLEKAIYRRLSRAGENIEKIRVLENKLGKYEVTIVHKPCYGKHTCTAEIIPIVNNILGKKMRRERIGCEIHKNEQCVLRLIEESRLRITTGVAIAVKEQSEITGDSYSTMELKEGEFLMALSDGMGSGKEAGRESRNTIELLEQFIEAGFEKELAVKLINSVLILKSREDIFSTLDICSVNLYTGIAEFMKIGAASAFLIRGKDISTIRSSSLPVGILKNLDVDKTNFIVRNGDIILMVTDGIADVIENQGGGGGEKFLESLFKSFKSNNPQDIAEYVLSNVKKVTDCQVKDDMTVIAARVWEK